MGIFDKAVKAVSDGLFPRRCPLCGVPLLARERVCGDCSDDLVFIYPPQCRRCGRPKFDCTCSEYEYRFERNIAPFVYTKSVRNGIHRLKFRNAPGNAGFFGRMMASCAKRDYGSERIDVIVCVPMHPADKASRGYNQSALLAKEVAQELGVHFASSAMAKTVRNSTQHSLPKTERVRNVENVFRVVRPDLVCGKTVLLCDDIFTTGSTLNECTRVLLAAGAQRVLCLTAAVVCSSAQGNIKKAYVR